MKILYEKPEIKFTTKSPKGVEEVLRITRDGFYYRGEKVDDVYKVYERFNEWLSMAERKMDI